MQVVFENLPKRFTEIHWPTIRDWTTQYLQTRYTSRWRIVPREPLGTVDLSFMDQADVPTEPLSVTLVTLKCEERGGRLVVSPVSEADVKVAADWAKRHAETTNEEFDWLPFACLKQGIES